MGLYGTMRTSASGMAAQANRLGSVSDNIANSNTTGYKRSSVEFASLVLDTGGGEYVSGSVEFDYPLCDQRGRCAPVHDLGDGSGDQGRRLFCRVWRRRPDISDAGRLVRSRR